MSNDPEDLLEHAVASFGTTPNPNLRELLLNEAQRHPETVRATINRIATSHANGTINSPWGVMQAELRKLADIAPKVAKDRDKTKAQQRAEQWMRAAGLHYPTWTETHDELFGERGQLAEWPDLADHFEHLYAELRPTGQRIDAEATQRAETWKQQRAAAPPPRPATNPLTDEPTCSKCGGTTGKHDPQCPRLARFTTPNKTAA